MASEESEFGSGRGLHPPLGRGAVLSPYDRLRATRMTDSSNPEASEDDVWSPTVTQTHTDPKTGLCVSGTLRPGVTVPVVETGPSSTSGQHKIVRTDAYNPPSGGRPAHDPEGYQDGEGAAWRNSVPPNPVDYE